MSLADEILAAVPGVVRRRTWWDDLSDDAAAELLAVRKRFQDGHYGQKLKRHTLAEMLYARCQERGWRTCDPHRLAIWLARKD